MSSTTAEYVRADGVRIIHDPYAPGMAAKYGMPGQTDNEGFDPYADTVGPGIYGGIVERDETGQVTIGAQYQNHNSRPGPVYAGGGYTPASIALKDEGNISKLLDKYPDLVNEVSTGGALPLHNCGMSRKNQLVTGLVVARGGDIEGLDTYGYTPLHRMASNNLAVGAQALLDAGADPLSRHGQGENPLQIARASNAREVVAALEAHGTKRTPVGVGSIVVSSAGSADVNGRYEPTDAATVPKGFDLVCKQNAWDTAQMWEQLNGGAVWFNNRENEAYIYFNQSDGHWWIDAPDGRGVYKAPGPKHAPPAAGYKLLGSYAPVPCLQIYRELG